MTVPLCDNWQDKVLSIKPYIHPLGLESKKLADDIFNKLQYQGRLTYTQTHTSFSFPVFIVWKFDSNGNKKGRIVVDIKKLNKLIILDSYPLPLQTDIITSVQGCTNLAILDTAFFFYQ